MQKLFSWICCMLMALAVGAPAVAAENGTADEAVSMVKKAVAYVKTQGKEKAFAEFSNPKGRFTDRDLYIFVYDLKGINLATGNGKSDKMVGKNLLEMRDVDGVYLIKEFIEVANTKGKGWVNYRWLNPVTNTMQQKSSYVEKVGDMVVGCGIYK